MNKPDTILDDLEARGLVHDTTDRAALAKRLASGPTSVYYGCDPTADSLHTGNLVGLLVLRRFQDAGHRPIALAGGATGMVGDPSGRSEERNLLDADTLTANVAAIKQQMSRILDLDDAGGAGSVAQLVDNRDWTAEVRLLDFLRDVGKHVTVNQMLARESVESRMAGDQGLSFTEFSYMLLQAHDYLWLHDHLGVDLQVGGSDQWGNILSGIDLIRRVRRHQVHGLSWPLLVTAEGAKLGKTTGARVWLDPARTSSYRFYQYWMQTGDGEVRPLLAKFTLLPVGVIDEIVADHNEAPERRAGQRRLAAEVTELVHGSDAAVAASQASRVLFGGDLDDVGAEALALVAREVPTAALPGDAFLEQGVDLVESLVATGLASSRGDARRHLEQRAIAVNGERVSPDRTINRHDVRHGRYVVLRKGKKAYAVLVREPGESSPGERPLEVDAPRGRR